HAVARTSEDEPSRSIPELEQPVAVSPLTRLTQGCHPRRLKFPAANSCSRQLLLVLVLFLYLGFGAAVFSALERQAELQRERQMVQLLRDIAAELSCSELPSNATDQLAELLSRLPSGASVTRSQDANRSITLSLPTRWDFIGGIFFSMTVITTIGYGNVAPSTDLGRGFCCLYAMIGIPLLALFLGGLAAKLKGLELRALRLECWKSRRRLGTGVACVAFILVGFLLYFVLPSLVFTYSEGWQFGVGMYYCFVTLSTIGFGDFIAGQQKTPVFPGYKLFLSLWIYTGLIYVSACIAAIQSAMERGAEALAAGSDDDTAGSSNSKSDERQVVNRVRVADESDSKSLSQAPNMALEEPPTSKIHLRPTPHQVIKAQPHGMPTHGAKLQNLKQLLSHGSMHSLFIICAVMATAMATDSGWERQQGDLAEYRVLAVKLAISEIHCTMVAENADAVRFDAASGSCSLLACDRGAMDACRKCRHASDSSLSQLWHRINMRARNAAPHQYACTKCSTASICVHEMQHRINMRARNAAPHQYACTKCSTASICVHEMQHRINMRARNAAPHQYACTKCSTASICVHEMQHRINMRRRNAAPHRPLQMRKLVKCWTTFQHRVDGSVSFNRNWAEYASGFGQGESLNYWMGLEQLHQLTATGVWRVRWEFSDWNGTWYWAENAPFSVGPASDKFRCSMGPLDASRSSVGQLINSNFSPNSWQFSTPDSDNDNHSGGSCAQSRLSGWWYGKCSFMNPNASMSRNLRQLVSKKKRRYDDGEFNLDLSYITSQVIAMGVPAETFERFYRNDISEVAKFLETHHPDRYKVYNLCAERSYNHAKFKDRVEQFAMQDHNPPLIHTIPYFCTSVYKWLQNGPDYVAAIHCKAGKPTPPPQGRTGVMICCYLLYESYQGMREQEPTRLTADQVLDLYDKRRTHNKKGVTIPSQRRYVYYYAHVLRHNLVVESCPLVLRSVSVEGGLPSYPPSGGCCLFFRCQKLVRDFHQDNRSAHRPIGESEMCEPKRGQQSAIIPMSAPIKVNGDVKIVFYNRSKVLALCEELFHCWFNTFFVLNQPQDTPGALWRSRKREAAGLAPDEQDDKYLYLTLTKSELDKACKDKMFPDTF
uniref:Protein-tyrosine-phosphatase n=1 Tax=Macrostomum lignano TaxID=282301 RepID=A0A1I8IQ02_9PLAT